MNEFTNQILSSLSDAGVRMVDILYTLASTPYGKLRHDTPVSSLYSALSRLDKQGLVKKKKEGRVNRYSITSRGKALSQKVRVNKRRSDGFSTIVIFDVPEQKKRERGQLRRYLQNNGYTLLQRSVFVGPYEPNSSLIEVITDLGLRKYVSILDGKIRYDF